MSDPHFATPHHVSDAAPYHNDSEKTAGYVTGLIVFFVVMIILWVLYSQCILDRMLSAKYKKCVPKSSKAAAAGAPERRVTVHSSAGGSATGSGTMTTSVVTRSSNGKTTTTTTARPRLLGGLATARLISGCRLNPAISGASSNPDARRGLCPKGYCRAGYEEKRCLLDQGCACVKKG
jgi:hypothetical protein